MATRCATTHARSEDLLKDYCMFPHHLDSQRLYDLSQPPVAVQRHPQNPNVWGLKNLSPAKWVIKLLEAAFNNPKGLRFDDFEALLAQCGWMLDRQSGSHRVWYSPKGTRLPVQEGRDGKVKPYQVRQFLAIHQRENP